MKKIITSIFMQHSLRVVCLAGLLCCVGARVQAQSSTEVNVGEEKFIITDNYDRKITTKSLPAFSTWLNLTNLSGFFVLNDEVYVSYDDENDFAGKLLKYTPESSDKDFSIVVLQAASGVVLLESPTTFAGMDSYGHPFVASRGWVTSSTTSSPFVIYLVENTDQGLTATKAYELEMPKYDGNNYYSTAPGIEGDLTTGQFRVAACLWDSSILSYQTNRTVCVWEPNPNTPGELNISHSANLKLSVCYIEPCGSDDVLIYDRSYLKMQDGDRTFDCAIPTIMRFNSNQLSKVSEFTLPLGDDFGNGLNVFTYADHRFMVYSNPQPVSRAAGSNTYGLCVLNEAAPSLNATRVHQFSSNADETTTDGSFQNHIIRSYTDSAGKRQIYTLTSLNTSNRLAHYTLEKVNNQTGAQLVNANGWMTEQWYTTTGISLPGKPNGAGLYIVVRDGRATKVAIGTH